MKRQAGLLNRSTDLVCDKRGKASFYRPLRSTKTDENWTVYAFLAGDIASQESSFLSGWKIYIAP
jgi:hypothetical protein